jgi:hypothetical protein
VKFMATLKAVEPHLTCSKIHLLVWIPLTHLRSNALLSPEWQLQAKAYFVSSDDWSTWPALSPFFQMCETEIF